MISPELLMLFATFVSTSCLIWLTDYAESQQVSREETVIPAAIPASNESDPAVPATPVPANTEHELTWNLSPFF